MTKKATILVVLLIAMLAVWLCIYRASYDNRSASNLSAYCNIDFRGVSNPLTHRNDSATLSLVDFRFSNQPLKSFCLLAIDDEKYKVEATSISATPPTYSLKDWQSNQCFKYTNALLFQFPAPIVEKIRNAATIRISMQYENSDAAIELPLSEPDLKYWKDQL